MRHRNTIAQADQHSTNDATDERRRAAQAEHRSRCLRSSWGGWTARPWAKAAPCTCAQTDAREAFAGQTMLEAAEHFPACPLQQLLSGYIHA